MRLTPFLVLSTLSFTMAQDIAVKGNSSNTDIFSSTNTSTSAADRVGVHGISKPSANWGIGVRGEASYIGVQGEASTSGTGVRYGGYFSAYGGQTNYGIYSYGNDGTNYAAYFSGNVYITGTLSNASDVALKKNISDIPSPLGKLSQLKPKSYELRSNEIPELSLPGGRKYGFLAQDIETVYPELVSNVPVVVPNGKTTTGQKSYKSVDYIGLIPILVGCIQSQQTQIDALKQEIQSLKK